MRRRPLPAWILVVVWAGVIFALSSVPNLRTDLGTWDLVLRKLAHTAAYAILAVLLVRATRRRLLALVLTVLYATSDEIHQTFVTGRHGSPLDVLIDTAGATIGLAAHHAVERRRR